MRGQSSTDYALLRNLLQITSIAELEVPKSLLRIRRIQKMKKNEKKEMNENTGTHSRNMHSSLLSPNILLM